MIRWLWILCLPCGLFGQGNYGITALSDLLAADRANPAWHQQDSGLWLGLPTLHYHHAHTGPAFRRLFVDTDEGLTLEPDVLARDAETENHLNSALALQTLRLQYTTGRWSLGFYHELIYQSEIMYPQGLVELYTRGNQPFIGQTISFAPGGSFTSFNNFALQGSYQSGRWSFGLRTRLLFGHQYLETDGDRLELFTDPAFYALTLTSDYSISTDGLLEFEDLSPLEFRFAGLQRWRFSSRQVGFALDAGISWSSDRLQVGVALADLGAINWQETTRWRSEGVAKYSGVTVEDVFDLDNISVKSDLDSLRSFLSLKQDAIDYRLHLPVRVGLQASFEATAKIKVGMHLDFRSQRFAPFAVACSGHYQVSNFVRFGLVSAYRFERFTLGPTISIISRRIQAFVSVEQLLEGLNPFDSATYAGQAGLAVKL